MKQQKLIPENNLGSSTDIIAKKICGSIDNARQAYFQVRQRFLNINHWQTFAGKGSAAFVLTDEKGNAVNRLPRQGDFFKIDIPGPGNPGGKGSDWVRIEAIEEITDAAASHEHVIIKVRPASSPVTSDPSVSHFFSGSATSTFIVQRTGKKVSAEVHGRNEKPNTKAHGALQKIRNFFVGITAPVASKIQWKALVNGLLDK
ncbi:MAG: hypothetical protein JWN76_1219 [Chitinophagaceae bacterium]|nr:hypothetical protein [Chitinophagaceae bacterium]